MAENLSPDEVCGLLKHKWQIRGRVFMVYTGSEIMCIIYVHWICDLLLFLPVPCYWKKRKTWLLFPTIAPAWGTTNLLLILWFHFPTSISSAAVNPGPGSFVHQSRLGFTQLHILSLAIPHWKNRTNGPGEMPSELPPLFGFNASHSSWESRLLLRFHPISGVKGVRL